MDTNGLLLREKLQDIMTDLIQPGSKEEAVVPEMSLADLQTICTRQLANKACLIVLDNLHALDKGTSRITFSSSLFPTVNGPIFSIIKYSSFTSERA